MNRKIIDYIVLVSDARLDSSDMPQIVVSWIRQGWQPFGGMCFCPVKDTFHQAMVKYEEEPGPLISDDFVEIFKTHNLIRTQYSKDGRCVAVFEPK